MGTVIVNMRVMPKSVKTDFKKLEEEIKKVIKKFTPSDIGFKRMPIAFGLEALEIAFVMPEKEGGTEPIEKALAEIPEVAGAETTEVSLI